MLSEYLRNGIVDSITRNKPLVVPVLAAQLHDGVPGTSGTDNTVDVEEDRDQITAAEAVDGVGINTGADATWVSEEGATVAYMSFHDALSAGNFLGYERLDQPVTVADGDTIALATFRIEVDD
ncbi:hypothetical protein [Mycobacterium sp. NAZ190054]|uniref:phage tail fiber protein n=1 Tax=Mycobacterium sp. NAZ190054 TaxID=1747766 RepID=UPI0007968061|nr:hypothetical protein [Mycobacterium sp. NAZ190054]KWX67075.1 hypothetical protein ASJ79_23085 [Mycobacterium sp. NAZ190054]